jgi:hypothetical protein
VVLKGEAFEKIPGTELISLVRLSEFHRGNADDFVALNNTIKRPEDVPAGRRKFT